MTAPILTASGVCKSYGVPVLLDVDLELFPGEIHAIVGENGAGKSTLARIFAGVTPPDGGSMRLDDHDFAPRHRGEARDKGVGFVMQELNLIDPLSVAESLFLDALPNRWGVIDRRRLAHRAREALTRVGLDDLDPDRTVGSLSVAQQQLVELAASLVGRCRVLLLDEPTAALTPAEVQRLFTQLEQLRADDVGIVFISHRLAEVEFLADRISVLRDGRLVAQYNTTPVAHDLLVREMVGRDVEVLPDRPAVATRQQALRVMDFSGNVFEDVTFTVQRGEIVGLAGLMGAGRSELLRAIFAADRHTSGQLWIGADEDPTELHSPRQAVRRGLALLPEDRKSEGLLLPFSVSANTTLAHLKLASDRLGRLRPESESRLTREAIAGLALRARSLDQPVAQLSGGNQQKVLLARWLLRDPAVLLVDEPTRGIDIGARAEVHRLLVELAGRGKALIVASSEHEELLALCDRILVLCGGRINAELQRGTGEEWTSEAILTAAIGSVEKEFAA